MARKSRFEFVILKNYPKERYFVLRKQPTASILDGLFGFFKRKQ